MKFKPGNGTNIVGWLTDDQGRHLVVIYKHKFLSEVMVDAALLERINKIREEKANGSYLAITTENK